MWFKNLQVYQLEEPWTRPAGAPEEVLVRGRLAPCPALSMQSQGWVAPADSPALVQGLERHLLFALGSEDKLLPASVIKDLANEYAAEWEQQHGIRPGKKIIRDFKDRATAELLPRAFVRRRITRAWIDPAAARIVVDAPSPARAEAVIEYLRDGLMSFAAPSPQPEHAPSDTLTGWLAQEAAPGRFMLGDECELSGSDDSKPVVRYLRHPLNEKRLRRHLDEGFRVSRLALTWNNALSLIVNDKLEIKRLAFLDVAEDKDAASGQSAEQQFETEFTLMTGTVSALLDDLFEAFGVKAASSPAAIPPQ
jgi:recombination associated protein RdgC